MGSSDNHMNPRRARRELLREMGYKPFQQELKERSPEERLQDELKAQHPRAKNRTVVEHGGKSYQCRYKPVRFATGCPIEWHVSWVEVPAGTQGTPEAKPLSKAALSFSRGRKS